MVVASLLDNLLRLRRMAAHVRREHLGQAILTVKYSRQMTSYDPNPQDASRTMDEIMNALKVASKTKTRGEVDQPFENVEKSIVEWADKVGLSVEFKHEFRNKMANARQRDKRMGKENEKVMKRMEEAMAMEKVSSSNRKIDIRVVIWGKCRMANDENNPMIPCSFKLNDTLDIVLWKVMQEDENITLDRNPHFYDDEVALKKPRKAVSEPLPFENKLATLKPSNPTLYVLTDRPYLIFFKCIENKRVFGNIVEIKGALFVKEVTGELQQADVVHANCRVNRIGRWGEPGSLTEKEDIFEKVLQKAAKAESHWNIECLSILSTASENVQDDLSAHSAPCQRSRSPSVASGATVHEDVPEHDGDNALIPDSAVSLSPSITTGPFIESPVLRAQNLRQREDDNPSSLNAHPVPYQRPRPLSVSSGATAYEDMRQSDDDNPFSLNVQRSRSSNKNPQVLDTTVDRILLPATGLLGKAPTPGARNMRQREDDNPSPLSAFSIPHPLSRSSKKTGVANGLLLATTTGLLTGGPAPQLTPQPQEKSPWWRRMLGY
ncbi:hypothetical protein BD410DRAFT_128737 [Rickenella mellea]|uniref:Uncharacterized protein n=1 Tax=Rickenella mellea TaxID=50990 RepID=A0A4Y7Q8F2_9AGAM|nr:hypothetical protein BD410DRAFT_128737 [Rickenella mellea]